VSQKLGFLVGLVFFLIPGIHIFGQLSAEFGIIYDSQCPPGKLNFVNKSTGFSQCKWIFGNGNSSESILDTLNQVYPNSGKYNVTLTVSDGVNEATVTKMITIFKEPKAKFITNYTKGCIPLQVAYTQASDTGDAGIMEYYWDFRNGVVIMDENPVITYSNIGEYSVLLRVTDANGCINFIEKEDYIKTYLQPKVGFTTIPAYACSVPATFQLTNKTQSNLDVDYKWTFGNGQSSNSVNPNVTYTNKGNFTIKLEASNNYSCYGYANKTVAIEEAINNSFDLYNFLGNSINEGDTICSGLYYAKNTTGVSGLSYWYVNGYNIYNDDDSITLPLTKTGWNTIRLNPKVSGGCITGAEKKIYINNIDADFEISETNCHFPLTVNYTNRTKNATDFYWQLAQGNFSTEENPQIIISDIYSANDYFVDGKIYYYDNTLYVKNKTGCVDSAKARLIFEHPRATLDADINQGCIPLKVTFSDSSGYDLTEVSKKWLFGDGGSSVNHVESLEYIYNKSGDFEAQLILENEKGCKDTSKAFLIFTGKKLNPDFDFSPKRACYNDSISFIDKTGQSDLIDYWSYSSSANLYSVCEKEPDPTLALNAKTTGYHDINLQVTYNGCHSDTTYTDALYIRGPIATYYTLMTCENPKKVDFIHDLDMASSWLWDFNDGNTDNTSKNPSHTYISNGDYHVKLTTYNDTTTCVHEFEDVIKVREIHASLNMDTIQCAFNTFLADASGSFGYIDDCYLEGFIWDFGDAMPPRRDYRNSIYYYYSKKGIYTLSLVAKDINGCTDTVSKRIHVFRPEPEFTIDSSSGCAPSLTVTFKNISTDTTIKDFYWNFGDGSSKYNIDSVQHTYTSNHDGYFIPQLVAYDSFGCHDVETKTIEMYKPVAYFDCNDQTICRGTKLVFNTSYTAPDSSYWQFGNGPFEKQQNSYVFNETGTFNVVHKVFKDNCTDSVSRENYISVEAASAKIQASDTVAECYPQTILFTHINEEDEVIEGQWDFDFKGYTSPGYTDSAYFSFSLPGIYHPELYIKTRNGCTDTQSLQITVMGPYAEYAVSDKYPCKDQPITFEMTVEQDVYKQLWDFGDGLASIEKSPTYQYTAIDTFIASLTISDINGCTPPAIYDTIYMKKVISQFSFPDNDTLFCVNELINPANHSIGASQCIWKLENLNVSDLFEPKNITSDIPGQLSLSLEIYDDENCSDTSRQQIIVFPFPSVVAYGPDSICRSIEAAGLTVETDSSCSVIWSPEYCIDNIYSMAPNATPETSTNFIVTVTDTIGCINKDSVQVYVHQFPELLKFPEADTTVLIGQSLTLYAQSDYMSEFYWDEAGKTSNNYYDTIQITPTENAVYRVNIKDFCFENEEEFVVNVREIYTIDLPDIFTPNGDGVNDKIYVKGGGIKELLEFKIFNRYGNLVYNSGDLTEGWDGYYRGKLQNSDVYTYYVKVLTYQDEIVNKSGSFNLVY
jgi:gliding motility-associated-like protein